MTPSSDRDPSAADPALAAIESATPGLPPDPPVDPAPGVTTGVEYGPNFNATPQAPTLDPLTPPEGKLWTVGTLTYASSGLLVLFAVLLGGDFALSMRERSVGALVQQMIKRLTPSDLAMALLVSTVPTALTLLVLPVVSYKSDRHRGRWGRRIPYLLIPAPLAAIAMVFLAFSEDFGRMLHNLTPHTSANTWGLICFSATWTVFECVALITVPMFGALVNDVVPRPVLGRFFGLFRAISLIAGILWFNWVYKLVAVHYRVLFIAIATIFGIGLTAMCLMVREGEYPPPAPVTGKGGSLLRLYGRSINDLRIGFSVGYYCWIFAALTLAGLAFQPVNLFSIPYSQAIHLSDSTYGHLVAITYTCSLVFAWPLGWLVDKAHALRCSLLMMALYAGSMVAAFFLIHNATTFGIFFVLHGVMSGCYFTTSAPLGQVLFPRLTYARYAAGASMVQAVVTLVFGPLLGKTLDWSDHNYRLTFLFSGVLAGAAAMSMVAVYFQFNRLGGIRGYVAPGDEDAPRHGGFEVVPKGH